MKLIVGTGNFNKNFILSKKNINNKFKRKLIRKVGSLKESVIDTSPEYSNAEHLIGKNFYKVTQHF